MRHQTSIFNFFLLTTFLCFNSCRQAPHQDYLIYYTSIATQMKDVAPKVESFWKQMQQGILTARQNENYKLNKPSLDTLKKSLNDDLNEIDSKIKIISSVKEVDKDVAFKDTILSYLIETKKLQEAAIPKVLELLDIGLDKITDKQKEVLQGFMTRGQEMQYKSKEIEDLSLEFQNKHDITNDELKKYGL